MAGSYNGLFFFEPGEDIDVIDVDSGQSLLENYTLNDTKDIIEVLGEDMKETVLWTNSGSTNPSPITLTDSWKNYKSLMITGTAWNSQQSYTSVVTGVCSVAILKSLYDNSLAPVISAIDNQNAYVGYKLTGDNQLTLAGSAGTYTIKSITGYN